MYIAVEESQDSEVLLVMFCSCAWAPSVEEDYNVPYGTHFHDAVDALKCSKQWKNNVNVRQWFRT